MWKLACDLGSRPKQGLVGDIKISKDPSLETLQRGHKLAPGKVKIVAKLRPCAKYDANISSPLPWPTCSPVLASLSDKEILPNQPCCIHFSNSDLSFVNWFILLIKSLFGWQKSPCQGRACYWAQAASDYREKWGLGLHPWFCLIKEISIVSDIISTQSSSREAISGLKSQLSKGALHCAVCLLINCLLGPRSDRIPVSIVHQTILTQEG